MCLFHIPCSVKNYEKLWRQRRWIKFQGEGGGKKAQRHELILSRENLILSLF